MVLGEKLWEGKAKTMSMIVKGSSAESVMFEHTWMAMLKGFGKAAGADGSVLVTANVTVSPAGIATFTGTGVFSTSDGAMAVVKGSGNGTGQGEEGKGIAVWSFMTQSPKLAWLNSTLALASQEGSPQEADLVVTEWI